MSQSRSPARGPSRASCRARRCAGPSPGTYRSEGSAQPRTRSAVAGSPPASQPDCAGTGTGTGAGAAAGAAPTTRTTLGSRQVWSATLSEVRTVTCSCSVPRASQITKVRCSSPSRRASSAGPAPGAVSTATLGWARQTLTARRSVRVCATTTRASSQGMPARAKAWATEVTPGTTSTSSPYSGVRRARTTPKNPGSPSARTTAVPRCRAMRRAARSMLPSTIRSASSGTKGSARWCRVPATSVAADSAARAASPGGEPSHPITVTRSAIVVLPPGRVAVWCPGEVIPGCAQYPGQDLALAGAHCQSAYAA